MSSATSYNSASDGHLCDMDRCVLRTTLSSNNFGRRFYGCQLWSPDSNQHCKFFRWLDGNTCPRGRATTPIVQEKFTRYKTDAATARGERDEARAMEAATRERERIAKRKADKWRLASRVAEDKVHKYKVALIMSWIVFGVYIILSTVSAGNIPAQLCLP